MHFALPALILGLGSAIALPHDLSSRQTITLDDCASVSTTLVALVDDIAFEQDGGLLGEVGAILVGAGGLITVNVYPLGGCVGAATSTVVNDLSGLVNVLVDAAVDVADVVAGASFTITA